MGSSNKIDISRFDPANASDDQIRLWLFAIIEAELEKDEAEIDQELIAECSDCEALLSHSNPEISQEEYALGLARIKEKAQAAQAKGANVTVQAKPKKRRFMRVAGYFLAAALAVSILTVGVVAAFNGSAAWEFITTHIQQILGMESGDTLESDKVALVKDDLVAEYDSVEEALKAGGFEGILYPTELPEGVRIERIVHLNNGNANMHEISFMLNSPNISYRIFNSKKHQMDSWSAIETLTINNRVYIIAYMQDIQQYQAGCYHNGYEHIIMASEYENLISIINSMEEIK